MEAAAEHPLAILKTSTSDDYLDEAAYQLYQLNDRQGTGVLLARLAVEPEPWLRERLVGALSLLRDSHAAKKLLEILTSDEEGTSVRGAAALGLGFLRETSAVEPLVGILDHGEPELRYACVSALGQIGDSRAIKVLIRALSFKELLFPQAAIVALGSYGKVAESALPDLYQIAANESEISRRFALRAIQKIENDIIGHDNPFLPLP